MSRPLTFFLRPPHATCTVGRSFSVCATSIPVIRSHTTILLSPTAPTVARKRSQSVTATDAIPTSCSWKRYRSAPPARRSHTTTSGSPPDWPETTKEGDDARHDTAPLWPRRKRWRCGSESEPRMIVPPDASTTPSPSASTCIGRSAVPLKPIAWASSISAIAAVGRPA